MTPPPISLIYTNYRGETSTRRIIPKSTRYGKSEWHPEPTWLLLAFDVDKDADREFALKDFSNEKHHAALTHIAKHDLQAIAIDALSPGSRVSNAPAQGEAHQMVAPWVMELTEDVMGKSQMVVGKTLKHPDGRTVKIISGQFWGTRGLSNFWSWQEVCADGTLGPRESGYGW